MTVTAYDNYLESEVISADPVQLVAILYRAAIDSLGTARRCLFDGDVKGRSQAITRAVTIVNELTCSLNSNAGGDIAVNLARLYDYILRLLMEANFKQVDPPLAEAEELMITLYEGWAGCGREAIIAEQEAYPRETISALY